MSHFARIENGVVIEVIVAEQDFINTLDNKESWVQTSYNTKNNTHPENRPMRGTFAGPSYIHDVETDTFLTPASNASVTFVEFDSSTDTGNIRHD